MAGLPQSNPMPGTVQLDPLTGQPMAPPAPPPPFAAGLAGPPAQWPPQSWLLGEDDQQPGPSPDAQQAMLASPLAPSTNDPAQMVPPPAAPAPVPPEGPPAPAPEALPQDYQAHDVPVVENPAALAAQHREMAPPAPAQHMTPEQAWMQHLDQSAQNQAEATKTITEANLAKNQAESEQGIRLAQDMQRRQASADSMYMQTYQDAKNKRAQLDREAQDIANQKIDPDRAWHSMSFGAQVLSGISAALVGLTTRRAMTGQNHVVDMLNGMAQRDMEAQKMDLETRIGVLGQRRGLLADDLAAGRDMLDFQYKSNAAAYEMGRNAIKSYVMQFDNPAILAAGNLQLNAINDADWMGKQAYLNQRQEMDIKKQQAALPWAELKYRKENDQANRENALVLAGMKGEGARQKQAEMDNLSILDPSGQPIPNGAGGWARPADPKKVDEEREKFTLQMNYWRALETYRRDVEQTGSAFGGIGNIVAGSPDFVRLRSEHAAIIPAYLKAHHIERLTAEDRSLVGDEVLPPPASWSHRTDPLPALNQAKEALRTEINGAMNSKYGVQDPDFMGTYEAGHPQYFNPGSTASDDRRTWSGHQKVPMDKTGKIIRQEPPKVLRAPPSQDDLEGLPGGSLTSEVPINNQRPPPTNFGLE